uniref:MRG domain binding protein n=2 Tax=Carnivora TaxID=33554 RepID=A0A8C7EV65_NEOVI
TGEPQLPGVTWGGASRQQPPWQRGLGPQPAEPALIPGPSERAGLTRARLLLFPTGVNRHFHMICIRDKFSQNIGRQVPSKVIWDHLSTMYDMQALHESEILPFPNPERNFVLPEEIIHEVREGKVVIEEEMKEEMKEDVDPHNGADDVFSSSGSLGKATEKSSKDKNPSDLGSKEGADKRKRSRVTDKVLTANSNPSSPSAAKRRRT